MAIRLSKSENAQLRALAGAAWESELGAALEILFEDFCRWADHGYGALELAERIHEFHDGIARELYKRYTGLPLLTAVARAIAVGVLDQSDLPHSLQEKLADEIEAQRRINKAE